MKKILFASILMSLSTFSYSQVGARIGLSVPNGIEAGADFSPNKHFRVGANYGYLHFADAANLQVAAGWKNIYFFGTLNVINVNTRGREAIATGLNKMIAEATNDIEEDEVKSTISGFHVEANDFKITDLGIGGGLGLKFGIFFIEGGIRTTRFTSIVDTKVDNFIDKLKDHVDSNTDMNYMERDMAMQEIESMRADTKSQIHQAYQKVPGNLKLLPEFRIGIRIPIGRRP